MTLFYQASLIMKFKRNLTLMRKIYEQKCLKLSRANLWMKAVLLLEAITQKDTVVLRKTVKYGKYKLP